MSAPNTVPAKCPNYVKWSRDLSIIIPSASPGKRMMGYGSRSLLRVGNSTLIEHQTEVIRSVYPHADIILVTGFDADKVRRFAPPDVRIVENENFQETGDLRSIGLGLSASISSKAMIIHGDLYFDSQAILCDLERSFVVSSESIRKPEVGLTVVDGKATYFAYGLDKKWGKIIMLTGQELAFYKNFSLNREKSRFHGFEGLNHVLEKGGVFNVEFKDSMTEIDTIKDMECIYTA